jgi:hypothetical protein
MAALETLARVAKQQRTWCHQLVPSSGSVLETARHNDSNREAGVKFLERSILWTRSADNILNSPSVALSQPQRRGLACRAAQSPSRQSPF